MYKVFFNDHILSFSGRNEILPKHNNIQVIEIESFGEFELRYPNQGFMKLVDNLIVVCSKPDVLWEEFRASLNQIPAAGGIVTNLHSEILFIKRFGKWDLPKGKIETGEQVIEAAVREVEEECGLTGMRISKKLPSTYHLYFTPFIKDDNNLVLKETSWFEMLYAKNEMPVPQTSEGIEEVRWFKRDDLREVFALTYNNLAELIQSYLD
ncbi:NUDIX domain-containing protein [Sunxiuqinia sp. A32]|uniref:NUDIX domain-containing protein n=1 Tax=Sunxiuqinia sp. A32 TaxID=3461496 RepID=UPI004045C553